MCGEICDISNSLNQSIQSIERIFWFYVYINLGAEVHCVSLNPHTTHPTRSFSPSLLHALLLPILFFPQNDHVRKIARSSRNPQILLLRPRPSLGQVCTHLLQILLQASECLTSKIQTLVLSVCVFQQCEASCGLVRAALWVRALGLSGPGDGESRGGDSRHSTEQDHPGLLLAAQPHRVRDVATHHV